MDAVAVYFESFLASLELLSKSTDAALIQNQCSLSLRALQAHLPILGLILRSTNVRNSFEVVAPLKRLAEEVLGSTTGPTVPVKLVLSSEWDYFPFTYKGVPALPEYVMIGLPASESPNPLLVPLAGHELGHAFWTRDLDLAKQLKSRAKTHVMKIISDRWEEFVRISPSGKVNEKGEALDDAVLMAVWQPALEWAAHQCEELFCDFLGLRLFGGSFYWSMIYLLSPGFRSRNLGYPDIRGRAEHLTQCGRVFGVAAPDRYAEYFEPEEEAQLAEADRFRLSVADEARRQMVPHLIALVAEKFASKSTEAECDRIRRCFDRRVPSTGVASIVDIVNAGWRAFHDPNLWPKMPAPKDRHRLLSELVLKSFEVYEIEQILSTP